MITTCERKPKQKPCLEELQEEIRERAKEIYKQRVREKKPGNDQADWLQAEFYTKIKYDLY